MKAAGAAILGAAVVGVGLLVATKGSAAEEQPPTDDGVDFDVDAEVQLARNYYAYALTDPELFSNGQLNNLEGLLTELGMLQEAGNIHSMRTVLFGDGPVAPEPLPDINFLPPDLLDNLADQLESDLAEEEAVAP